jgi:hypothetical protein
MLFRSDLQILDMFFANEIDSKDKLTESYKLISMIEANQQLNSTKSNLANYVQTIRDWEKNIGIEGEKNNPAFNNIKECMNDNLSGNFFNYLTLSKSGQEELLSFFWDFIPRDEQLFSLIKDTLFQPNQNSFSSKHDTEFLCGPKFSPTGTYDIHSSILFSAELQKQLEFLVLSLVIEKLLSDLYQEESKESLYDLKLFRSKKLNGAGNFVDNNGKSLDSPFQVVLQNAAFGKSNGTLTMFSTGGDFEGNYKNIDKIFSNTKNVYDSYNKQITAITEKASSLKEYIDALSEKDYANFIFENYSNMFVISSFYEDLLWKYSRLISSIRPLQFTVWAYRLALLLTIEIPYPLNNYLFEVLWSNTGSLLGDGRAIKDHEIIAVINYLHRILFNTIPAIDSFLSNHISCLDKSKKGNLLKVAIEAFDNMKPVSLKGLYDKDKSLNTLEAGLNKILGYSDNNGFVSDCIQNHTILTSLFGNKFKRYINTKYRDIPFKPYQKLFKASAIDYLDDTQSVKTYLSEWCADIISLIQEVDNIKLNARKAYNDHDSKSTENGLSQQENFWNEVLDECKNIINMKLQKTSIYVYMINNYPNDTYEDGYKNLDIVNTIFDLFSEWINSEIISDGDIERLNSKGELIEADSGVLYCDTDSIQQLLNKYLKITKATKAMKNCLDILYDLNEKLNSSYRKYLDNTDKREDAIKLIYNTVVRLIDFLYWHDVEDNSRSKRYAEFYWKYRNNYVFTNQWG